MRIAVQQSAYWPFHFTETALLSVHNDLVRSIDNGKISLLVLLDLSAAFHTVDHNILLSILSHRFSINSTVLKWFESYLTDRTQYFTYAGEQTYSYPVDCSVPQGSVLGPRCFVSYTEDITDVLDQHAVQSHLYADDTQFHDSCQPNDTSPLRRRLSNCAADINSWCQSRHLQLNANKTEIIWFGSRSNLVKMRNTDCSVQIGSSQIQPSTVVRDLGLHLDSELSMTQHIAKVAATCFCHLPSTPPPSDSQARRYRSDDSSRPCSSHVTCRLLQLNASRFATIDARTTTTSAECRGSSGLRARIKRTRHSSCTGFQYAGVSSLNCVV